MFLVQPADSGFILTKPELTRLTKKVLVFYFGCMFNSELNLKLVRRNLNSEGIRLCVSVKEKQVQEYFLCLTV